MAYTVPQVKVFQDFNRIPTISVQNQNAFIIGPSYHVFPYTNADKALITVKDNAGADVVYDGTAISGLAWPNLPANSGDVDLAYAKLYADNARLTYKTGLNCTVLTDGGVANRLKTVAGVALKSGNNVTVDPSLPYGGVNVGDYVVIPNGSGFQNLRVVAIEPAKVASSVGALVSDGGLEHVTASGTFNGQRSTDMVVTIMGRTGTIATTNNLVLDVMILSTVDGSFVRNGNIIVKSGVAVELGQLNGVTFTLTIDADDSDVGLHKFGKFHADAATFDMYDTLVLNDAIINPGPVTVQLQAAMSGIEIPERLSELDSFNWVPSASGFNVAKDMQVLNSRFVTAGKTSITCTLGAGGNTTLYMEYRARRLDTTFEIDELSDMADIAAALGHISPDNPLAYGVYLARKNSGNRSVFYLGVEDDTVEAWLTALAKAANHTGLYSVVALSTDAAVQDAVQVHVQSLSDEDSKKWRIAFFGMGDQTLVPVYTRDTNPASTPELKVDYTATSVGGHAKTISFDDNVEAITDLAVGDEVRYDILRGESGDVTYKTATITKISTDTQVELNIDIAMDNEPVEVYHYQTVQQQVTAVRAQSMRLHSRRAYNCYSGVATTNEGYRVTGEYLAAAVAGLCSSVAPQQGLTNIELKGFSKLESMYRTYSPTQLNRMAEAGTLLVAQDYKGGPVYIRHQISTAYIDGNLNTSELSLVKNHDSVSYVFAERFKMFIGVTNITPETLAKVEVTAKDILDFLMSNTSAGDIGPQLMGNETKINSVSQDPVLKDTVNMDIDLEFPKPFNTLNITLRAV